MKKLFAITLLATLAACGGGGDAPAASIAAAPVQAAPVQAAPVQAAPQAPVVIQPTVPLVQAIAWVDATHYAEGETFAENLSKLKARSAAEGWYASGRFLLEYCNLYVAHEQHFVNEVVAYSANMNLPVRIEIATRLREVGISDVLILAVNLDQMSFASDSDKSWLMNNYGPMIANLYVIAINNIQ